MRRDVDAVASEEAEVVFDVVADLEDRAVFEHAASAASSASRASIWPSAWPPPKHSPSPRGVAERQVGGRCPARWRSEMPTRSAVWLSSPVVSASMATMALRRRSASIQRVERRGVARWSRRRRGRSGCALIFSCTLGGVEHGGALAAALGLEPRGAGFGLGVVVEADRRRRAWRRARDRPRRRRDRHRAGRRAAWRWRRTPSP